MDLYVIFSKINNIFFWFPFIYSSRFIYRITPATETFHGTYNSFLLTPFSKWAWVAIIITIIVFLITFFVLGHFDQEVSDSWFKTIATISQQGFDFVSEKYQTKIVIISLQLTAIVLFNFYTSSMVTSLMIHSPQGPRTIEELLVSPLTVSFEDLAYNRALFTIDRTPIMKEMFEKKIISGRASKELPPFTTIREALPYIRSGKYAFHSEINLMYPFIAKNFTPAEICELRVVNGALGESTMMMMLSSKQNQYSEMFKIG